MYFPYLRARQYELLALRDLPDIAINIDKVIPIVEPIKDSSTLHKSISSFIDKSMKFILVENPKSGDLKNDNNVVKNKLVKGLLKDYNKYYLAFIIDQYATLQSINSFITRYPNIPKVFIHFHGFLDAKSLVVRFGKEKDIIFNIFIEHKTGEAYRRVFRGHGWKNILIADGFIRQNRNADYPPDDFFSDLIFNYKAKEYYGFGDFLIVGDVFSKGFAPHAVALHLTYLNKKNQELRVRHFVSDAADSIEDTAGKFMEALTKMINYTNSHKMFQKTQGLKEFKDYYKEEHYPGLGYAKKMSMKHHIETVLNLL